MFSGEKASKRNQKISRRAISVLFAALMIVVVQSWTNDAYAATAIRINTGGPAQNVGGVQWQGCTAISACSGYAQGGFPWSENPASITGVVAPDSQTIQKSEWTAGRQSGVPWGQTAFTFTVPVPSGTQYDVKLHFTELNKDAVGKRLFDVRLNGNTVLTDFDIFKEANGKNKAITRTFRVTPTNGNIVLNFIAKVENAKISAIQINSVDGSTPTPTTSTTTTPPTTTTTVPPSGGSNLSWSRIANSPTQTSEANGGALGGKLYYFGGYLPNWAPLATSYAYTPSTDSWERIPDLPRPLTHAAVVVDGNSFIIAGGYGSNGGQVFGVTNVYRYNPTNRTYTNLPNLPVPRGSGGAAVVGRTLHFMSGVDTSRKEQGNHWTLNLDNTSAGWQTAPAFPSPRTHFAVATRGQYIYTFGGLIGIDQNGTELNGVYRYDTVAKTWSQETPLPVAKSHFAHSGFMYNDKFWIIGGEDRHSHGTADVYSYDFGTKRWTTSYAKLPEGRFSGVAGEINGQFYFATGNMNSTVAYKATFN